MKDFVPHKEALALKELGFREDCFGMYDKKYPTIFIDSKAKGVLNKFNDTDMFLAPLYSQAFRWFREKHGYVYLPCIGTQEYSYKIWDEKKDSMLTEDYFDFNGTYEEAELACLRKLIEIVKDGK
jgi:hypothetical protein